MTEENADTDVLEREDSAATDQTDNVQIEEASGKADGTDTKSEGGGAAPDEADRGKEPGGKDEEKGARPSWPDEWRELMAGGDEDVAKIINRYGSPRAVAKALKEARALISSGKLKREMPDPSDEKAMAEWRKEQGIPDDPSGYKLPEVVTKRLTDDDKPLLASFTEFAHKKGAPQQAVDIASEWYVEAVEAMQEQQAKEDLEAKEAAEEALRQEWARGEFKANMELARRFVEDIPGIGENWSEARLPDGRRIGDIPEFVMWASDMGRSRFGDATFANSDSERRHMARKQEIEQIMKTDIDRYYAEKLDVEYAEILEREVKRRK